jgi:hypothetical protein
MIRVSLPQHLRTLAGVGKEVTVDVDGTVTQRAVLDALEQHRTKLEALFPRVPGAVTIVLHDSPLQLALAQPHLVLARRFASPAARRYMAGWFSAREVHTLAPEVLRRSAGGAMSHQALALTPQRVYTLLVAGANNMSLPPPFRPRTLRCAITQAWQPEGVAQYLAGQVPRLRPAIATRLREGLIGFPPGPRDAGLVAGALFDMLAGLRGESACVRLARNPLDGGADAALESAFELPLAEVRERWRAHLERLATPRADVALLDEPGRADGAPAPPS